jgi:hypothetical protein
MRSSALGVDGVLNLHVAFAGGGAGSAKEGRVGVLLSVADVLEPTAAGRRRRSERQATSGHSNKSFSGRPALVV